MVEIRMEYEGGLRCRALHGPSEASVATDAPVDNHGKGESFSPTDLVATALGSCMLTTMGIVAERHDWDLTGATAKVVKKMVSEPFRRIGALEVEIRVPRAFDEKVQRTLEKTAHTCPVHRSLKDVEIPVAFQWGA